MHILHTSTYYIICIYILHIMYMCIIYSICICIESKYIIYSTALWYDLCLLLMISWMVMNGGIIFQTIS